MKQSLLLSYIGDSIFSGLAKEQIRKDTVELSIPAKEFFQLKFVVVVVIVLIFFPWRSKDVLKPVVFPIEQASATVDLHIDLCEAVLLHLFFLFMWTHNHLPSKKSSVVFWLVGIESEVSQHSCSCATFCDYFGSIRVSRTFSWGWIPFLIQSCLSSLQGTPWPWGHMHGRAVHVSSPPCWLSCCFLAQRSHSICGAL